MQAAYGETENSLEAAGRRTDTVKSGDTGRVYCTQRMNKRSRMLGLLVCVCLTIGVLCGFSIFNKVEPTLWTEKQTRYVYQNGSAKLILSKMKSNYESAEQLYDKQYMAVIGRITKISSNNKTVKLAGINSQDTELLIDCSMKDSEAVATVGGMKIGDHVRVFGEVRVGKFPVKYVNMDVYKIEKTTEQNAYAVVYTNCDGEDYDKTEMAARSLAGGKVIYYVPQSWETVETELPDVDGYEIDGYQYKLNEIAADFKVTPESMFVFYFSNMKFLKKLSDKAETESIEMAIVKNILPKDNLSSFPTREVDSYFGHELDYYDTSFKKSSGKEFNVEFVFTPVGDDLGILVYMYVYDEVQHLDDIMALMRMTEK